MTNQVIINFQSQINELFTENKDLKKKNADLESQINKVKFIFVENKEFNGRIKEKEIEIIDLNKQQIISMNNIEKANQEIKKLKGQIKNYREIILDKERKYNEKVIELKNMENTLEEKDNTIKDKIIKITEQENQIKLLYNDNILWEQKYNDMVKENENFK